MLASHRLSEVDHCIGGPGDWELFRSSSARFSLFSPQAGAARGLLVLETFLCFVESILALISDRAGERANRWSRLPGLFLVAMVINCPVDKTTTLLPKGESGGVMEEPRSADPSKEKLLVLLRSLLVATK